MAANGTHHKHPDDVLDWSILWRAGGWLRDGDNIAASAWTVPDGLTVTEATHDNDTATVWLAGGTPGADYRVTNRITTSEGRTAARSFVVHVETNL